MRKVIGIMGFLILPVGASAEPQPLCPPAPPFGIATTITLEPISEAFDGDQAQFDRGAILAGKSEMVPVAGVYQSSSGYAAYIDAVSNVVLGDNSICTYPKTVRLSLFIRERIFRFASQIKPGSCVYNVTLAHHRRQADSDSQVIRDFEPIYAARLRSVLLEERFSSTKSAYEGQVQVEEKIIRSLEETRDLMKKEEDNRRAALNTKEEIAFIHSCH